MSREDTQHLIGKVLPAGTERDAIHIAVFPAVAGKDLYARDDVAYDVETGKAFPCRKENGAVGIVDPFFNNEDGERFSGQVAKGERFYIFVYPNTVTGLRHNWEHPGFKEPESKPKSESENWLRAFAMEYNMTYPELMRQLDAVESSNGQHQYISVSDMDAHGSVPEEIWDHYEKVTGKEVSETVTVTTSFSCSC